MAIHSSHGPKPMRDIVRPSNPNADSEDGYGCVRYLEHSHPNPQAQWHFHDEYELHLVVSTSGRVFVGDYIGSFEPGHLVLIGPGLPHHWLSTDGPPKATTVGDVVLRFPGASLLQGAAAIPELAEALPLLGRARHGIEFFGVSEHAREYFTRIKASQGLCRFAQFSALLGELALCTDYRLLSVAQMRGSMGACEVQRLDAIVTRITADPRQAPLAASCAEELEMTEGRFGRFFRSATGRTYTNFVHRIRIDLACQLLREGDKELLDVCREVGFTNVWTFTRHFNELKGISPTEFRRQVRFTRNDN